MLRPVPVGPRKILGMRGKMRGNPHIARLEGSWCTGAVPVRSAGAPRRISLRVPPGIFWKNVSDCFPNAQSGATPSCSGLCQYNWVHAGCRYVCFPGFWGITLVDLSPMHSRVVHLNAQARASTIRYVNIVPDPRKIIGIMENDWEMFWGMRGTWCGK